MALSFAPFALKQDIIINQPEVVTKSYPHYWEELGIAGFAVDSEE